MCYLFKMFPDALSSTIVRNDTKVSSQASLKQLARTRTEELTIELKFSSVSFAKTLQL